MTPRKAAERHGPPMEGGARRRWDPETFVCAFRGHDVPAARVRQLSEEDLLVGVETRQGARLGRCLRCDAWVLADPAAADRDRLGPAGELKVPERGRRLRDSLVLKLIAVDRGLHSVVFALLAVGLLFLRSHLAGLQDQARVLARNAGTTLAGTGQDASRSFLLRELDRLIHLRSTTLRVLLFTAVVYSVVEGVEAVGLWRGRRWAEYLTAVATAGFLPFEIDELLARVTVGRVVALVVNLAVLVYLLWHKRLFGIRGGAAEDEERLEAAADLPLLPGQPFGPGAGAVAGGPGG